MVVANILGTGFIVAGVLLAFWSLWWIIQAARTNPGEREAEVEARERVARGEGWGGPGAPAPAAFSDDEMAELSAALQPSDLAEAGVDAVPKEPEPRRRRFGKR